MSTFRRLLVAIALAVSTVLVALPAAPASANSSATFCFPVRDLDGNIIDWVCFPLEVEVGDPDPDPCLCPWSIDFREGLVLEDDIHREYLNEVARSLELIDQAAHVEDPKQAYELRELATDHFGKAASVLAGEQAGLAAVGRGYLEKNVFEPMQVEWLSTSGAALAEGLTYVSDALAGPRPHPWREVALQELDVAYESLTKGVVG